MRHQKRRSRDRETRESAERCVRSVMIGVASLGNPTRAPSLIKTLALVFALEALALSPGVHSSPFLAESGGELAAGAVAMGPANGQPRSKMAEDGTIGRQSLLDPLEPSPAPAERPPQADVGQDPAGRPIAAKIFEQRSISDYVRAGDDSDFAPAIERAAAAGVTDLLLPAGTRYTLKRPFALPVANIRLRCAGRKTTEIRLLGENDYFGIVGTANAVSHNFYVEGCLFTKERSSSKGAVFKIENVYKWGFDSIRIFGENKIWRVLELTSTSSGISRDVDVDNIRERAVYGVGGTGAGGLPGGLIIDNLFDLWYVSGAGTEFLEPAKNGVFYFDDNFQAIWIMNLKMASHSGYAVYLNGTPGHRVNNSLNLIFNPNIESSRSPSGIAYFGAVAGSQIGGPASWSTGRSGVGFEFPAVRLSSNSQGNTVRGLQVGLAGGGAQGLRDEGIGNIVEDIEFVGYDADADVGLSIGATAIKGRYSRIKAMQLKRVIADESPDVAGHAIRGVDYLGISGPPLTGLVGTACGNKMVESIANLDAGAPSVDATSVLSLPDKGATFTIRTAGTINRITPTYLGRRVTLLFAQSATSVGDLQGVAGTGAIYLAKGLTTDSARWRATFEWRGDYWWEISRVP